MLNIFKKLLYYTTLLIFTLLPFRVATAATFTYDNLNRLTQVTMDNGDYISYSYDKGGNLLTVTTSVYQQMATSSQLQQIAVQQPVTQIQTQPIVIKDTSVTSSVYDGTNSTVTNSVYTTN